jgi:ATP-binding cassette subfamily B protein
MLNYLMKKYALSKQGAKDLIKATIACTLTNIVLMFPVGLLFMLVEDLINGNIPTSHYYIFVSGIIVVLTLIYLTNFIQYGATFFATYKESGVRRINLAEKLRKLPLSFFGKKDLSDLTSTIMSDSATLETAFSHWIPEFFGSIISTLLIAVSLFIFDWRMALAALWVLPLTLSLVLFSRKVQNYFTRKNMEAKLSLADGIQESLEILRDLKSNNAEHEYLKGLDKKIKLVEKRSINSELGVAVFVVTSNLILKLGIATVALVGSLLLKNDTLEILTFFMYLLVVSRLYDPMAGALQNLAAIISTDIKIKRMREIQEYPVQSGDKDFISKGYDIEFNNVGFSYNKGETVLDNVSFTAKQGEVTALIGPSGGGKSTVAKLAARFWDADKGSIKIGGTDIKTVDTEKLLSAFSIVFQDVTLFNNTIMENIRIGKKNATDEEVIKAAEEAQCSEFINRLPGKYNTFIGENGSKLSGGERQRISIARALLKNSPIILLDEATASLDAENETLIQSAISRLVKNKTVLIIAHRMRTVEGADKLILLKDGIVAESGKLSELKKKNGLFAKMLETQKQSGEWRLK